MMEEDRGRLIYTTPRALFLKNRINGYLTILGVLALILISSYHFILLTMAPEKPFEIILLIMIFFFITIILIMKLIEFFNKEIIDSVEIYQNGYVPYEKRVSQLITRNIVFLPYKEIYRVEYNHFSALIEVHFKDGSMDIFKIKWEDIKGYIEFSKTIKQNVKGVTFPHIDAVVNLSQSDDSL